MRGWILFKPSVLDGFIWHCGLGGAASLLPYGCKVQAPQLTSIDIQWVSSHSCQVGALSPHVVSTHTATAGWWWKFIFFTSLLWHYPSVRESGLSIVSTDTMRSKELLLPACGDLKNLTTCLFLTPLWCGCWGTSWKPHRDRYPGSPLGLCWHGWGWEQFLLCFCGKMFIM